MQIQVNSSNHIEGNIRLNEWVRSTLEASLALMTTSPGLRCTCATRTVPSPARMTNAANWRLAQKAISPSA